MRRITLQDIARKTNVDVSTVSRVVNEDAELRISEKKRQEVLQAARELGYTPHRLARSLRMRRNYNIGYVLCETGDFGSVHSDLEFPVSRTRIYGLEEALSSRGYILSLLRLPRFDTEEVERKVLRMHLVDGLVCNYHAPPEAISLLEQAGMPTVLIDPITSKESYEGKVSAVFSDRAAGIQESMRHLHSLGHRTIAFISSNGNFRRLQGYSEAVRTLGLSRDERLIGLFEQTGDHIVGARANGKRIMLRMLETGVPCTAVQAGNDGTAFGIIDAVRAFGKKVPQDIAVMGYDDLEGLVRSGNETPFLSTIRDPNFEMGTLAAELLLAQIEEGASPRRVLLQPKLELRAST